MELIGFLGCLAHRAYSKNSMKNITKIFCEIDDFCKVFIPLLKTKQLQNKTKKRNKPSNLSESEVMTIMILFHSSNYRNFKNFYTGLVSHYLQNYFPSLVSYNRFVELQQSVIIPMVAYLQSLGKGEKTELYFIDSTPIKVCDNKRINNHKVFKGIAQRGKSSMGWFFGFKLHLVVNDLGEIISFVLTPGNTDDRDIDVVSVLSKELSGKIFGDRGYISKELFESLLTNGLKLVTKIRKNMKNKLMDLEDKILLRKRSIIETINDQLKNISQIEHSRHRSPVNFFANLISGLIAYCFKERKPRINLNNFSHDLILA